MCIVPRPQKVQVGPRREVKRNYVRFIIGFLQLADGAAKRVDGRIPAGPAAVIRVVVGMQKSLSCATRTVAVDDVRFESRVQAPRESHVDIALERGRVAERLARCLRR